MKNGKNQAVNVLRVCEGALRRVGEWEIDTTK